MDLRLFNQSEPIVISDNATWEMYVIETWQEVEETWN